jgi:hypothetical protein
MRGRAATPEAEAARREKIRQAVSRRVQYRDSTGRFTTREKFVREPERRRGVPFRRGNVRVLIVSDYRLPTLPGSPQRQGWNYEVGREYVTYIDPRIASNPSALQHHLNLLHPNRVHYRARVVEYL